VVYTLSPFGMVYDQIRAEERMIIEAAKKRGFNLTLHNAENLVLEASNLDRPEMEPLILQRCVSYFRSLYLTAILESKGIRVVNPFQVAFICGNKLLASMVLAKAGVPTPRTFVTFDSKSALKALDKVGYPAFIKPVVGSWGRLVAPLKDLHSAKAILEAREFMFPLYQVYYIQEQVKRPPRDIRSFVIGDRAVAAIYRYAPQDDWRTNTARGGRAEACKVAGELEEITLRAAKAVGGEFLGVDLMESPEGLMVHEVNYSTEFRNTVPVTGVDIPGILVDYMVELAKK